MCFLLQKNRIWVKPFEKFLILRSNLAEKVVFQATDLATVILISFKEIFLKTFELEIIIPTFVFDKIYICIENWQFSTNIGFCTLKNLKQMKNSLFQQFHIKTRLNTWQLRKYIIDEIWQDIALFYNIFSNQ